MNRLSTTCCAVILLLAGAGRATADGFEQARELLTRMASAMGELSYQGTFVYVRGSDVETMRITHVNDGNGVRERLYALDGPPREVIRDREGVRCALGEAADLQAQAGVERSLFPDIPVQELSEARARYLFEVGNQARISGFLSRRLSILPRDQYRYGYDLWLDEDTGLLLRWVLYDSNRRTLAKLMFTDLKVGENVDASELDSHTPKDQFVRLAAQAPQTGRADSGVLAQPEGVPPGFRLAAHGRAPASQTRPLEHLVLSDGLASVSVYIEDIDPASGVTQGLSRMGTTNAYSRTAGGRLVTAIGEVPAVTVKAITNAFAAVSE